MPRAAEIYKDRLIAYSLGNFCTGKGINVRGVTGYAPLLLVDLDASGRVLDGKVVSFVQDFGKPPRRDPDGAAARLMCDLGREDFPETTALTPEGRVVVER